MTTEKGRYNSPNGKFFQQALFADTFRGVDSTGIALIDMKTMEEPEVYKKALAAPDFLQLGRSLELLDNNHTWNLMLGHNRAATKGGVHHHTSHPLQIGDITMVHNGTITNHRDLTDGKDFVVDSEAIANAIDLDGIEEVVKSINGAFTLVWHDATDNTVNIIRNKERPMYIGISKDANTVLFASEGGMLKWLAARNGIVLDKVFQPAVGMHYKYTIGGKNWANTPLVAELPLWVYVAPYSHNYPTAIDSKARLLKGLGEVGKDMILIPDSFMSYGNGNRASGIGTFKLQGNLKKHVVNIYNMSKKDWDETLGCFLMADAATISKRLDEYVLTVNSNDYITYDLEELEVKKSYPLH